jgi:hypothetical protein
MVVSGVGVLKPFLRHACLIASTQIIKCFKLRCKAKKDWKADAFSSCSFRQCGFYQGKDFSEKAKIRSETYP